MTDNQHALFVGDIMEPSVVVADGLITVAEAIALVKTKRAKAIIVQKRHQEDELGIVLLSDIAKKVIAKDKSADRVNLYEIMTKPLISVPSSMKVKYCARLFQQFGISRAPVIDNEEIKGMISYTNMVFGIENPDLS